MSHFDDNEDRIVYGSQNLRRVPWHGSDPTAPNHGKPWGHSADALLRQMAEKGEGISTMCGTLGRKPGGIEARLEHLGILEQYTEVWSKKHGYAVATQPKKEAKIVNFNHLITLLQKNYTTAEVKFAETPTRAYTYKVSNAIASDLKAGDTCVVHARGEFKCVTVAEVHDKPRIDPKSPYEMKWIVCKVDATAYEDQVRREAEAVQKLQDAERMKAQQEAIAALIEGMGDREEFLKLINGE